ncbi:MAG TPA: hypothetical protein VFA59_16030 [Vicinamibacterales bacterium]|nr:hypothetical protein [Vicinamibacterales bacterium]
MRFDKVATRVVERLKTDLHDAVPSGTTVLITITAPIRLASKTTAAVKLKARSMLEASQSDARMTVHGNRIRIRVVHNGRKRAPKVLAAVHNPDVDTRKLLTALMP